MTTTLIKATEQRDIAIAELQEAAARNQLKAIESATRVVEHWDLIGERGFHRDSDDWRSTSGLSRWRASSSLHDREDGKFVPLYETEQDLARQRATNRALSDMFPTAIGVGEALTCYIVGEGATSIEVQAKKEAGEAESMVETCQLIIDAFIKDNHFSGVVDRELSERMQMHDGEAYLELDNWGNQIYCDFTEPDGVTEPQNKRQLEDWALSQGLVPDVPLSWSFGVVTPQKRTWMPLAYHVVRNAAATDWSLVPEKRMERFKLNTSRAAKRGVSDLFGLDDDMEGSGKLERNTREGAAIQAAIAFIREHAPGKGATDISNFLSNNATGQIERPGSSPNPIAKTRKVERFPSGTVKDTPPGVKYHAGPLGTLRSPVYIEVAAFVRRCMAARWLMPENIISSDASNNNYASIFEAQSPFVKFIQGRQGVLKRGFESLAMKVLRLAWEKGIANLSRWSWEEITYVINIVVNMADAETRDMDAKLARDETLNRMKIKSLHTIATDHGLNYDEEQEEIAQEPQPAMGMGFESLEPEAGRRLLRELREEYP